MTGSAGKNNQVLNNPGNLSTEKDLIGILRPEFQQKYSDDDDQVKIIHWNNLTNSPAYFSHNETSQKPTDEDKGRQPWKRPKFKIFPEAREPDGSVKETHQQKALRRLRSRLSPYAGHQIYGSVISKSDQELLFWLKVYDYNILMTEAKLMKHLEVRTREDMDELIKDYTLPRVLAYHYPGGLCGVALDGSRVLYEQLGRLQMRNVVLTASREEIRRFMLYRWEHIRQVAIKSGTYQVLVVVDVKGITKRSLTGSVLQVMREILELFQENYMWMVKEFVVLNRSPIAPELYLSLRPYISRTLACRTTVLSDNFLKYMCQKIARHEIPAFLGGYKCDIDNNPYCRQDLNWHSDILGWAHITNPFLTAEVEDLNILGGERLVKDYYIASPHSRIVWKYLYLSHPIEFSLYLDDLIDEKCLQRPSVIKPENSIHSEVIVCKTAGHYLFVFDNWQHLATKFTGILKVLLSPPDYVTSKYATRIPLGVNFDMSKPVGPEEKQLRRMNSIDK